MNMHGNNAVGTRHRNHETKLHFLTCCNQILEILHLPLTRVAQKQLLPHLVFFTFDSFCCPFIAN